MYYMWYMCSRDVVSVDVYVYYLVSHCTGWPNTWKRNTAIHSRIAQVSVTFLTLFFLNDKRLHCFNQYLRWTRDGGPLPVLDFNFKDMEGIKAETFDCNVLHCTSYASLFPIFLDDSDKGRARQFQTCSVTSAQRRGEFPPLAHCSWILRQQVRFDILKNFDLIWLYANSLSDPQRRVEQQCSTTLQME